MLMDMFNHLLGLLNKSGFLSIRAWPHSLFFLVWEKLFWGSRRRTKKKMGCWRSTPPTCIQRNKMTWDDDRLSFFSAFLPRGHISTLLSTLARVPGSLFGSITFPQNWRWSLVGTLHWLERGKPVMRLVWQQVSRQMWLQSRLSIRNTTTIHSV